MNLEPNKNQTKLRKKAPTSSYIYLPPSHNLLTSSRGSISKEKILENIKKNNLHQNNFANASQLTNRSNINSKSKSSSRILSREHSQIKQKNCDKKENKFKNSNENLKIINDKAIEQPIIKNKKIFEKSNPPLNKKTISECFAASNHNQQHLSKKYIGTSQQSIIVNSANLKINSKQINKKNSSTKTIRQISAADSDFEKYHYCKNIDEGYNSNLVNIKSSEFKTKKNEIFNIVDISEEEPILECEERISIEERTHFEEKRTHLEDEKKNCPFDANTLNFLISQENNYRPDAFYFQKTQNNINSLMRTILMDWMMEVCSEFTLKRETFHLSISYVDRYLSKVKNIERSKLQLIGLSSMYIAAKIEEIYAPKIVDFMKSAGNAFKVDDIKKMELNLLLNLQFYLNPPSLNMWSNWYMNQWDLFIENPQNFSNFKFPNKQFKLPNEESYLLFREFMQILDNIVLDVDMLQYKPRAIIASIMYLILGKSFKEFNLQQILEQFPFASNYLISNKIQFNYIFSEFLSFCFGFDIYELLPTIQFVSTFFGLNILNNLPIAAKLNKENVLESHFEEFLAFQTHNKYNIENIKKRKKI